MSLKKSRSSSHGKALSFEEEQTKINEVRKLIGPLSNKLPNFCSDASISRYLRARNWNTKKASKMLIETIKWRLEYKPEQIHWEEIAHEAETGKIYRANYLDKFGRTVLVMRPGFQNTSSTKGQIRYLVYCIENAILNLAADQEQMVWLIDFQGWNMSSVSIKVTRETAHILQDHYPERLGFGILYNPPKIFESFWAIVKPFLEPKTYRKVKFVYSNNSDSQRIMWEIFDSDKLESTFGGCNPIGFDYKEFEQRMRNDDLKFSAVVNSGSLVLPQEQPIKSVLQPSESPTSEHSRVSDEGYSSSDIASPKSGVIFNSSEDGLEVKVSHSDSANSMPPPQIDVIQK